MWNTLSKLPKLETDHCSVGVNFYDETDAVYQGYYMEDNELFYWYSYEHRGFIENVKGWMALPDAPGNAQQQVQSDGVDKPLAG